GNSLEALRNAILKTTKSARAAVSRRSKRSKLRWARATERLPKNSEVSAGEFARASRARRLSRYRPRSFPANLVRKSRSSFSAVREAMAPRASKERDVFGPMELKIQQCATFFNPEGLTK